MNAKSLGGGSARLEVSIKSKAYLGASGERHDALGEVAFALEKGEVGAVVGPSGCGKTTLLRIVAGLDARFEGAISRRETDRLAVVFQEPRLLPWRAVEDNVRLAAPDIGDEELAALLATLGLSEHRRHFPRELSLGLARRVALARAMAVHPDLLLLDEPFASLDNATASDLVEQIIDIVAARAITTLLVTHDLDAAVRLADVVFVLSERPARLAARIVISSPRRGLTPEAAADVTRKIRTAQ
ncbi:MAG TPA: ATP-binding cassette domain-containing protein [Roseiarcus sp.]|nr:ATP-binding cassette domain-containing protein [Roseiarcus sp.]